MPDDKIYPDLSNDRFDIRYHQLRILGSDVRRATSPGRYGTGTSSTPIPDDGGASNVDSGSSSGGGGSTGGSTGGSGGGSGGGGDSGIVTPPAGCDKRAWGWIWDTPIVKYCENEIGPIVWTHPSTGVTEGTLAGAFPDPSNPDPDSGGTWLMLQKDLFALPAGFEAVFYWVNVNTIRIETRDSTGALTDGLLNYTSFEIRTCCDTTPVVEECCEVDVLSITPIIE
jgi:hypothetical protein